MAQISETAIRFPEEDINLLAYLTQKSGLFNVWNTNTSIIANDLGISQQSVSRVLRELENAKLIIREASTSGVKISLADNGRNALKKHYELLRNVFSSDIKSLSCKITSGLGEGRYYMSFSQYKKQFIEKLGFEPFEGTLNLEVDIAKVNNFLLNGVCININGFETKERTFGGLKAFNVKVSAKNNKNNKKINAALIMPDRTHHDKNVVEIIANKNLRNKLKLKDNQEIEITLD
ncbi:CTP-dependent riboflavin kinase [Candidatus Woesearchaeota archaeon]|nr:CTP-dependent riboflavin kinase [Candidatus Woesearchaeota archaeon]